jgi:hypothetical protein
VWHGRLRDFDAPARPRREAALAQLGKPYDSSTLTQ